MRETALLPPDFVDLPQFSALPPDVKYVYMRFACHPFLSMVGVLMLTPRNLSVFGIDVKDKLPAAFDELANLGEIAVGKHAIWLMNYFDFNLTPAQAAGRTWAKAAQLDMAAVPEDLRPTVEAAAAAASAEKKPALAVPTNIGTGLMFTDTLLVMGLYSNPLQTQCGLFKPDIRQLAAYLGVDPAVVAARLPLLGKKHVEFDKRTGEVFVSQFFRIKGKLGSAVEKEAACKALLQSNCRRLRQAVLIAAESAGHENFAALYYQLATKNLQKKSKIREFEIEFSESAANSKGCCTRLRLHNKTSTTTTTLPDGAHASSTSATSLPACSSSSSNDVVQDGKPCFAEFWRQYPRKDKLAGNRQGEALQVWEALNLETDTDLRLKVMQSLILFCNSVNWKREDGRYVPKPSVWLRELRWANPPPADRHVFNQDKWKDCDFEIGMTVGELMKKQQAG
ncbi:MAG: hypothetical protein H6R18_2268 [Proteobacteria bacterium]|nr:hypothetical protein [Pseudomonadota bacterium]